MTYRVDKTRANERAAAWVCVLAASRRPASRYGRAYSGPPAAPRAASPAASSDEYTDASSDEDEGPVERR